MTTVPVNDNTPRKVYEAIPAQTVFPYDFFIFEETDLAVYIDGVLQTLTDDYTISGENTEEGGNVTLVTGLTGGEIVLIEGAVAIERLTDLQQSGKFDPDDYNIEQDRNIVIMKQLYRDILLRPGFSKDTLVSGVTFEDPEDGKVYYFDSAQNKFVNGPTITQVEQAAEFANSGVVGYYTVTSTTNPTNGIALYTTDDPYGFYTNTDRTDVAVYVNEKKQCLFRDSLWLSLDNGPSTNWLVLGGGSSLNGATEGSVVITAESDYADSTTIRLTSAGLAGVVHLNQKVKGYDQDSVTPDHPSNSITHVTAGAVLSGTEVYNGYIGLYAAFDGNDAVMTIQRLNSSYHPGLLIYTVSQGSITLKSDNTVCTLAKFERVASAVNYPVFSPAATGQAIKYEARGSNTNIDITVVPKGTGVLNAPGINVTSSNVPAAGMYLSSANNLALSANSARQVRILGTASAVNYVYMHGAGTGTPVLVGAGGSDTNVNLQVGSQGTSGYISLVTNIFGTLKEQVRVLHTSSTDYLTFTGGTGEGVISVDGSNSIVNIEYETKGEGYHVFLTGNGASVFEIGGAGTIVNGIGILGGATGVMPQIYAYGATNVALELYSKGNEAIRLYTDYGDLQLQVTHTNAPTASLSITGGAGVVTIGTVGSATDRDIALVPGGAGLVKFGVKTGTGDVAIDGYVNIKTAAGTTIKLATVA